MFLGAGGDSAGSGVTGDLDFNGDRRADVVVGAPGARGGAGAAFVVSGYRLRSLLR